MRRVAFLLALLMSLPGCASPQRREIHSLALVMALSLERQQTGALALTLLVQGGEEDAGAVYSGTGGSVAEALSRAEEAIPARLFFGHTELILLDASLWGEDFLPVLDWFARSSRLRQECAVALTEEAAGEFLRKSLESPVFLTDALHALWENESFYELSRDCQVSRLIASRKEEAPGFRLPLLRAETAANGDFVPRCLGYALVLDGRAVGRLPESVCGGLRILESSAENLLLSATDSRGAPATAEVHSLRCQKELLSTDPLRLRIVCEASLHLSEYRGQANPMTEEEAALRAAFEGAMRDEIGAAIALQRELSADLMGLAAELSLVDPEAYDALSPHWREALETLEADVEVKAVLLHSQQLQQPLGGGA